MRGHLIRVTVRLAQFESQSCMVVRLCNNSREGDMSQQHPSKDPVSQDDLPRFHQLAETDTLLDMVIREKKMLEV